MYVSEAHLKYLETDLINFVGVDKFNEICRKAREKIDNVPIYDGGYRTFWINKRTKEKVFSKKIVRSSDDKHREINAPYGSWKELCKELNELFMPFTEGRYYVKGFNKKEGVQTNANYFALNKCRYGLNMDLENAFGQISFSNIRTLGRKVFKWKKRTATKFALIMTFKGHMCQGNPLSPLLMNLFALYVDFRILNYLKGKKNLVYTRYADDCTIGSRNKIKFKTFLTVNSIISQCGFAVNKEKTKFMRNIVEITGCNVYFGRRWKPKRGKKRKLVKDLRALKRKQRQGQIWLERLDKNGNLIEIENVISGIYAWLYPSLAKKYKKKKKKGKKKTTNTKQNSSNSSQSKHEVYRPSVDELKCSSSFLMMRRNDSIPVT